MARVSAFSGGGSAETEGGAPNHRLPDDGESDHGAQLSAIVVPDGVRLVGARRASVGRVPDANVRSRRIHPGLRSAGRSSAGGIGAGRGRAGCDAAGRRRAGRESAASEVVHRFWGKQITQEQIATRIHGLIDGKVPELVATRLEILSALAPDLPPASHTVIEKAVADLLLVGGAAAIRNREAMLVVLAKVATDWAKLSFVDWNRTIAEMRNGVAGRTPPVVIALAPEPGATTGHVGVLVELEVREKRGGAKHLAKALAGLGAMAPDAFELLRARLLDPWDGSIRELSGKELEERTELAIGHAEAVDLLTSLAQNFSSIASDAAESSFLDRLFGDGK
jgi:hypothetical protein